MQFQKLLLIAINWMWTQNSFQKDVYLNGRFGRNIISPNSFWWRTMIGLNPMGFWTDDLENFSRIVSVDCGRLLDYYSLKCDLKRNSKKKVPNVLGGSDRFCILDHPFSFARLCNSFSLLSKSTSDFFWIIILLTALLPFISFEHRAKHHIAYPSLPIDTELWASHPMLQYSLHH